MAIAGRKALVKVSGEATTLTEEATTESGGRTIYTITDTAKRVLVHSGTITVETSPDGSAWSAATGYTLDRLFGTVTFDDAQDVGTEIRVSGEYLPMTTVADAKGFTLTVTAVNQPANVFGDTYVKREQTLRDSSGSLEAFRTTVETFDDALSAGDPVVVEMLVDSAVTARAWAILNSEQVSAAVEGLVEMTVGWEGAADADGRSVSFG